MNRLPLLALSLSFAAQAQTPPPRAPAPVDAATQAAPPSPVVRRVDGKVTFATATTAYIDAGALEGVAIGQVVRLTRASQPSGTCTIRETADHSSTCTGEGIRAGDRFAFETTLPGAPPVAKLAPIPTEEELDSRNAVVTGTPVALVEAKVQPRDVVLGQLPIVRGDLGYAVWLASPSGPGDSQRLQLDIQVNGLDAFAGFRFFADARLMQWTQRNETYLPGSSTQLLVYDLELAQRDPKRSWSASFGRVMPWFAPGSTVFDGAQGGLRFGRTEIGIFGGTVPDTYTTEPTLDRYTGGVYANFEAPIGSTLLSGSARAAVVQNPAVLRHYEGELLLNYWAGGVFSASGDLRMGFGDVHAPSYIDSARLALSIRPVSIFWISGGFSYWGLTTPNDEPIATYPGPSRRADGSVGVDATDWLRIAALGGWVDDLTSSVSHTYVGPEVTFTKVLAGLSFGYLKDLGWVEGQSAWSQIGWAPMPGTRLTGRISWFQTTETIGGVATPTASNDVGLMVNGTVGLNRWLGLRASVLVRAGIDDFEASVPFGTATNVFLVGTY
ncbi:MAG: hypothetical protein H6Q88_2231 [Anaeromyxobacteraceae bacterium]|nr:hypothetical protein [Anaeromyxobacteraceae bacterium]